MAFREDRIGDCRLILGDCREVLQALPAESVHCCITSPPYFGLRDYGVDSQIGLETTPAAYIANLVEIMRQVRRVLREDGTLWLNIGDSYAGYHGNKNSLIPTSATNGWTNGTNENLRASTANRNGLKSKDLIGIPWMLAFALRDDGWYLRRDVIWAKPNPMPESVTDRPTSAHEYLFLLTKAPRYFYDAEAIKEPFADARMGNPGAYKSSYVNDVHGKSVRGRGGSKGDVQEGRGWNLDGGKVGRNKRSVWTIASAPYRGAHFATFPPALVEPCILAGTSERGVCQKCGAPWARVLGEPELKRIPRYPSDQRLRETKMHGPPSWKVSGETIGWHSTCSCNAVAVPATVIDPFAGASTTALVASKLGRASISIELSAAYHDIACRRIATAQPPLRAA